MTPKTADRQTNSIPLYIITEHVKAKTYTGTYVCNIKYVPMSEGLLLAVLLKRFHHISRY